MIRGANSKPARSEVTGGVRSKAREREGTRFGKGFDACTILILKDFDFILRKEPT